MSIRLAAPQRAFRHRIAFAAARAARMVAANDNMAVTGGDAANDMGMASSIRVTSQPDVATLNAALRHFARHGIAAAEQARAEARAAKAAGDEQGFVWWLSICSTLDRRMARDLARQAR